MTEHTPSPQSVVVPVEPTLATFDTPDFAARTHAPHMESWAYNQMPKAGWSDLKLFQYDGTDLYQWFGKKTGSVFEDAEGEPFAIKPAAPAPSSLAGGAWRPNPGYNPLPGERVDIRWGGEDAGRTQDDGDLSDLWSWDLYDGEDQTDTIQMWRPHLAALSPEAPAREPDGMTEDERRRWLAGRSDWREDEWQDHCGRQGCEECRGEIPMTRPRAVLTPRHEAPDRRECDECGFKGTSDDRNKEQDYCTACGENSDAGGPDECAHCGAKNHMVMACAQCGGRFSLTDDTDHEAPAELLSNPQELEAPAEGAGEVADRFEKYLTERARSRQLDPEDIHGMHIGDVREVVLTVADLRTAIIALRARSSAPEAREAVAWLYETVSGTKTASVEPLSRINGDKVYGTALYTHPAAPSADKLQIAVEALEKIKKEANEPRKFWSLRILETATKALAALKAEGAK